MIYLANQKGPLKKTAYHDPNNKTFQGFLYRPGDWAASTVYIKRSTNDYDVVIPTTFNGFYYKIKSSGTSDATEPATWATVAGETTTDGTVEWEAVPYNLMPISETITASVWTASDSVTLTTDTNTTTSTQVRVEDVPDGVKKFTITNHITKSNGEEASRSMEIKVNDQ